jgi:hypothetical protein
MKKKKEEQIEDLVLIKLNPIPPHPYWYSKKNIYNKQQRKSKCFMHYNCILIYYWLELLFHFIIEWRAMIITPSLL